MLAKVTQGGMAMVREIRKIQIKRKTSFMIFVSAQVILEIAVSNSMAIQSG